MSANEFSRVVDLRSIGSEPVAIKADASERAALAQRFGLIAIDRLEAEIILAADGAEVQATGRLHAAIIQSCAVSGEDLPAAIEEPLAFRFVPRPQGPDAPDEEIELEGDELDEIPYSGTSFDLGEAVAQSLALAIDPYATGPEAERARRDANLSTPEASGPFAALAALRKQ